MGSRYVPPALRRQSQSNGDSASSSWKLRKPSMDDSNLVSPEEVKQYFWPVDENNSSSFGSESGSKTLHDSAATPGQLAFLFLFYSANPRWEGEHIVFTKSTLELLPPATDADGSAKSANRSDSKVEASESELPGAVNHENVSLKELDTTTTTAQLDETAVQEADSVTSSAPHVHNGNPGAPVAIFKQVSPRRIGRSFAFEGWFRITNIAYLEPHSSELVRMLDQKWTHVDRHGRTVKRDRNQEQWQASLGLRWAVVKFTKHEDAERERGPPKIERLEEPAERHSEGRKGSVNELLEQMRLQDEAEASVTAV